ncbi:MAG: hemerythrin domain-containing protein [Planctomycetaceae bacterium]|nr:hemerythrin domain-containing protein [Planctomycetaceae bacterium]
MLTKVTGEVFREIDSEHQELERQYAAFDEFLNGEHVQCVLLRRRLAELAVILKCHFEHEEEEGYFAEIIALAPRLSYEAEELEAEHDALLGRLEYLDDQLTTVPDDPCEIAKLRQEFADFIASCRDHEHRETALVQEAWLTDIGLGE